MSLQDGMTPSRPRVTAWQTLYMPARYIADQTVAKDLMGHFATRMLHPDSIATGSSVTALTGVTKCAPIAKGWDAQQTLAAALVADAPQLDVDVRLLGGELLLRPINAVMLQRPFPHHAQLKSRH